jgi:replicative DNA helicase
MASPAQLLISKVIATGDIETPVKHGLKPDQLDSTWGPVWLWTLTFWRTYGKVPTERAFKLEHGSILVDADAEAFTKLLEEIFISYRREKLVEALSAAMPALDSGDIDKAFKEISSGIQKASIDIGRLKDVDIIQNWEERIEHYAALKLAPNPFGGLPTGFTGLDLLTGGFAPQQLITLVGEAKRGKSLITLIMAMNAHRYGAPCLFVSFEMTAEEQATRFDALAANIGHNKLMRGQVSEPELSRLRRELMQKKSMQPFIITSDTSALTTVSSIAAKVQEHRPGLLVVDGVYLMDDENGEAKGSPQALTNITRSLKRIAQQYDIPVIETTQVLGWKLGNKKSRSITSDAIGYSSSFVQDSDLVIGVEIDPEIKNQAILRIVLARNASPGQITIEWDWDDMSFAEVGGVAGEYDDDSF